MTIPAFMPHTDLQPQHLPPRSDAEPADTDVMAAIAAGDTEPLGILIRRYIRPVTLLAERLVGDRDGAEDVAEEAFLVVLRRADTFDPGMGNFQSWLYGIVRSIARWHTARTQRRRTLWERWRPEERTVPSPSAKIEARETLQQVTAMVARLPEMQRQCFELHVIDNIAIEELALMYEISETTVRQHIFRARRNLRAWLATTEDVS